MGIAKGVIENDVIICRKFCHNEDEVFRCFHCRRSIHVGDNYVMVGYDEERATIGICLTCAEKVGAASRGKNHHGRVIANITGNEAFIVMLDDAPVKVGVRNTLCVMNKKAAFDLMLELQNKYPIPKVHVYMMVNR